MKTRSEKSTPAPMASTRADLRQMSTNSKASVAELKTFLAELKGKSPQEMLGVVAASQLARSIILSTVLVIAAIGLFTVVPFLLKEDPAPEVVQAEPSSPSPPPETPAPAPTEPESPATADPLSELGVGEERQAPPNENPLENNNDDFLKDLE
jgi:hypothetical protein